MVRARAVGIGRLLVRHRPADALARADHPVADGKLRHEEDRLPHVADDGPDEPRQRTRSFRDDRPGCRRGEELVDRDRELFGPTRGRPLEELVRRDVDPALIHGVGAPPARRGPDAEAIFGRVAPVQVVDPEVVLTREQPRQRRLSGAGSSADPKNVRQTLGDAFHRASTMSARPGKEQSSARTTIPRQ